MTLRPNEIRVAEALARHYSASWAQGENPPDIYLEFMDGGRVGVEITELSQMNRAGDKPRLSETMTGVRLAKELNRDLQNEIPAGRVFILILPEAVSNVRKTVSALKALMLAMLSEGKDAERDVSIEQNEIGVLYRESDEATATKVWGCIGPGGSGYNTLQVTSDMLEAAVKKKTRSCCLILATKPLWLALLSDYFFAEERLVRAAFETLGAPNPFQKVLFIDENATVCDLTA